MPTPACLPADCRQNSDLTTLAQSCAGRQHGSRGDRCACVLRVLELPEQGRPTSEVGKNRDLSQSDAATIQFEGPDALNREVLGVALAREMLSVEHCAQVGRALLGIRTC